MADRPLGESIHEVVVARLDGQPEAEMWAELLRNEGIPTVVVQLLPGARLAWGMVPCELHECVIVMFTRQATGLG
jgi:hypothetical protein